MPIIQEPVNQGFDWRSAGKSLLGGAEKVSSFMAGPGGMILGGASALFSAFGQKKAAEDKLQYIGQQRSQLTGALGSLGDIYEQQTSLAKEEFGEQREELGYGTGQVLTQATAGADVQRKKGGFATAGDIEAGAQRKREAIYKGYGFQERGLETALGKTLMGYEEEYASEKGALQAQLTGLDYEAKQARSQTSILSNLFT